MGCKCLRRQPHKVAEKINSWKSTGACLPVPHSWRRQWWHYLWSRYDLHVVGQHGVLCKMKWEIVRPSPTQFYFRRLFEGNHTSVCAVKSAKVYNNTKKVIYQSFGACPTLWRRDNGHRYATKKLRHCHPVYMSANFYLHCHQLLDEYSFC